MGFWKRVFGQTSAKDELTQRLMDAESLRQERANSLEIARIEFEKHKLSLEMSNLTEIAEQKRIDREQAAKLREQQRGWAADAREKKRLKSVGQSENRPGSGAPVDHHRGCRVCSGEGLSSHSAAEIIYHVNGHRDGLGN